MTRRMRQLWTIVRTDLVRLVRDRTALFFIAVLPFVVILALANFVTDGDDAVRVAIVDADRSDESAALAERLGAAVDVDVDVASDERDVRRDLQLGRIDGAVLLPAGFGEALGSPETQVVLLVDRSRTSSALVDEAVDGALAELGNRRAVADALGGAGVADPDAVVGQIELSASLVSVELVGEEGPGGSTLTFVAGGQLLLFMFVNSLAAGAALIEMRRLGVAHRVLSGPMDAGDIVTGVALARLLVAVVFGAVVAVLAVVVYDVDWGSLAVLGAVIGLFALVSAGGATLIGAVLDDPDAATTVGIPVGLAMAALGGCMFPIWLAPDAIQVLSKVLTPHAWALDALMSASFDGAGAAELWTNLLVLCAWAAVLLFAGRLLARRRLRRA
jgi:ABC-2 type transport system permease protein